MLDLTAGRLSSDAGAERFQSARQIMFNAPPEDLARRFSGAVSRKSLRYLKLAPQNNFKMLFTTGQFHLEARRWDIARGYYQRGLLLSTGAADVWRNLGAVESGEGDDRKAVEYRNRALGIRPDTITSLINLAQALRVGRFRGSGGDRDYAPAASDLALRYLRTGKPNDAIPAFRFASPKSRFTLIW
ncbi:MAG: tetratricopeptide repeat protein [Bryobacterales bacterium]|nr:tetratricopeptide repeat protein [Bryobacterales bacterium]